MTSSFIDFLARTVGEFSPVLPQIPKSLGSRDPQGFAECSL